MTRISKYTLTFTVMYLFGPILFGQGYDTKFKAVGFQPGDVYHTDENISVSLNGGGVVSSIPLGSALPGPLPLQPVINTQGKWSQSLNQHQPAVPLGRDPNTYMRWLPISGGAGEIHPGKLYLTRGANAIGLLGIYGDDSSSTLVSVTPPNGTTSEYYDGGGEGLKVFTSSDTAYLTNLIGTFAPDWVYASNWASSSLGTVAYQTSDHSILIFGPHDHKIYYLWDYYTNMDGTRRDQYAWIPTEILQIKADQIILWRQSRNVYKPTRNDQTTVAEQWWWRGSVYHPVWIKTRSGFKVNVTVNRLPPKERTDLVEQGLLKGWTMSYSTPSSQTVGFTIDSTSATPLTFQGMAGSPTPTGLTFSGDTPTKPGPSSFTDGTSDGYETIGTERQYDVEYKSDEMWANFSTLVQGPLTTTKTTDGLVMPSGKTYKLSFETRQGAGVTPPHAGVPGGWSYYAPSGAMEYWSMVTQLDVTDATSSSGTSTRTTKYQWAIPTPKSVLVGNILQLGWASTHQGVAQTLPDGQTILTVFSSVPSSPTPGAPALDFAARTFMAQRSTIVARYQYPSGDVSWQGFFGATPVDLATTNWVKRERMEGWDLRAWSNTMTAVTANVEPRATRTITEVRAYSSFTSAPTTVTELDDWDSTNNQYRVKRTYILPSGSSPTPQPWAPGCFADLGGPTSYQSNPGITEAPINGALSHSVTQTTFVAPAEALYGRPDEIWTKQLVAPASGATGFSVGVKHIYDTTPGRAHVLLQKIQLASDGTAGQMALNFTSSPEGLFTVDRLKGVTLSGSAPNQATAGSLTGLVGATYSYIGGTVDGLGDSSGRFMTQIQLNGVTWAEKELAHDGLGRPLSQTDPNGFTPIYARDSIGRLTSITPPNGEIASTISYPSLRQTNVIRGASTSRYYYNAFGEVIAEDRLGAGGTYTHRLYSYDLGGRKTFESLWRSGPFTATMSADWMSPGTETVTAAWTEQVCTATIYDPDLGQRVCIAWASVYHPAVVQTISGTLYGYDSLGRPSRVTNANGEITETRYDIGGNPLITQKVAAPGTANQTITTFEKDVLGRLAKVTDALSQVTTYSYDPAGRILGVQQWDSAGHAQNRGWIYDGLGRLVVLDQPESGVTYYTSFTVTGKPVETVYGLPSGWRPAGVNSRDGSAFTVGGVRVLSTAYDTLGRPTSISGPGVNQTFTYDAVTNGMGKLAGATSDGSTRTMEFLGLNGRLSKLTRSVDGLTFVQTFNYDGYGKLTSRGYPGHTNPAVVGPTQNIVYDDARSLPISSAVGATALINLGYDPISWAPIQMSWANGASSNFTYRNDQTGLATMTHAIPGQTGASWTYSYNELGLLTNDSEDYYNYDALGRLMSAFVRDPFNASTTQGLVQQFTYDAFGNRTSLDSKVVLNWTQGALPPTVPSTTAITDLRLKDVQTYGFNASDSALWGHNQLPTTTVLGAVTGAEYDPQGNLTRIYRNVGDSTTQVTMSYDALGRVYSLGDANNATTQTYGYDDEGLRMKVVDSRTGVTTYNIYNEVRQLAATFTKTGSTLAWKRDIIYVGTKEVAEVDTTGTEITLVDHLGSPRFGWRGSGAPVKQKFLPFGEALADTTSASKFGKGFTNHEQTDASGLIYMQARFYLPMFGRFGSPDPAQDQHFELTQSWNIYSYVQNNPTMKIDPMGLAEENPDAKKKLQEKKEDQKKQGEQQAKDHAQTGKTGTQAEMTAKHKDEKPVKATVKGKTVTYEYANGDKFTITGTHPNRDQNPGNVRTSQFARDHGSVGNDGGFAIFPTPSEGWSAMHDVITGSFGNLSVNDMIAKYAPPSENDTKGYQATATKLAGVSGDAKISSLTAQQVGTLMNVMAKRVEGWSGDPYVPK